MPRKSRNPNGRPARPLLARVMEFISPEPNSGCWLWTGQLTHQGYGRIIGRVDGGPRKYHSAHRLVYRTLRGHIPDGLVLDHLCRIHSCVNPAHLEPVTCKENIRRGETALANLNKTHCPQGHPYSPENVYLHAGRHCRICRHVAMTKDSRRRQNAKAKTAQS